MEVIRNSRIEPSLRLLVFTGNDFTEEFASLSRGLLWLRWFDFKHTNLPPWLLMIELRVLELYGTSSLNELWKDNEHVSIPRFIFTSKTYLNDLVFRLTKSNSKLVTASFSVERTDYHC